MKLCFCSQCGSALVHRIPKDDNRFRYICDTCDTIHYQNPHMLVGCLPVWQGRILLCRRAIEPRKGYWTLPAGFMENGESTVQGAQRETWEEACAKLENIELYRLFDLPHINQVYLFYRADVVDGEFGVGAESSETRLFGEEEIPWNELAFSIMHDALRNYFSERKGGRYTIRIHEIDANHDSDRCYTA